MQHAIIAGKVLKDCFEKTAANIAQSYVVTEQCIKSSILIDRINYGYMRKVFLKLQWNYIGTAKKVVR